MPMPQQAFDNYAEQYDSDFTKSSIGSIQRGQVRRAMKAFLAKPKSVMEINCGTGEDAIWMSSLGHQVLATDISEKMIEVAKRKQDSRMDIKDLRFKRAGFFELKETVKAERFDLIFSNFGGLNCIGLEDTRKLSEHFNVFTKENGFLMLVYMSRSCLWERLYFRYKGDLENARRRTKKEAQYVDVEGAKLAVWYYNPKEIVSLFSDSFELVKVRPIGLFVPPSYMEGFFRKRKRMLSSLTVMDKLMGLEAWSKYADHFVIVLKKK